MLCLMMLTYGWLIIILIITIFIIIFIIIT